jgi:hypothetical protein
MEINPAYITFEQARLLKEKGIKFNCDNNWEEGKRSTTPDIWKLNGYGEAATNYYPAPEQWQVVEWLRLTHGIWVSVDWMKRIKPYNSGFYCHLRGTNKSLNRDNFIVINDTLNPGYEVFNSPTEAYEAAIEYILNNLI